MVRHWDVTTKLSIRSSKFEFASHQVIFFSLFAANWLSILLTPINANSVTKVMSVSTKRPLTILFMLALILRFGLFSKPRGFLLGSYLHILDMHLWMQPSLTIVCLFFESSFANSSKMSPSANLSCAFFSSFSAEILVSLASSKAIVPSLFSYST